MEKTKINDILKYDFYSNLEISKDQKYLAFLKTNANLDKNKYDSFLYAYDIEKKKSFKISDNKDIGLFIFDKDDNIIYKEKSDDEFDYFYKKDRSMEVGSLDFKIDKNVSFIKDLKNGYFLIKASNKLSKDQLKTQKENSFYKEVTNLPFWFNGSGYIKDKVESLYFYKKDENKLEKIREFENETLNAFAINKNLDKLALVIGKNDNKLTRLKDDLVFLDLKNKKEKIIIENTFSYYDLFFSSNDEIIFIATDMKKGGINEDAFIFKSDCSGNFEKISPDDFDKSFGNSIGTDARYGSCRSFDFKDDKLYFIVTEKEESKLYSMDLKGELKLEISGCVEDFVIADDNIYYFYITEDRLSHLKDKKNNLILLDNKINSKLGKIHEFFYESNGDKIRGYVLLPVDFDKNKKYPTLLSIHGGPKTELSNIFHHEHQVFANDGYIIIYTNPHGSSGNGVKYSDIRGKYGSIDYQDLMNFTDNAIEKFPQIDKDNMGVYGGSYGGFMTNWIISHTDRFKAANSQRSISNWTSFYGVSDIGYYFGPDQTGANPWDNLEKMWDQSPIKYAKNVKTPTMFIHSDEDYRCPLEQGLQMYTRIKENGVETKMYIFHGENHELSRSGRPKARIKRLEAIKEWFDRYLK
ncbi:alpha/beta hydrolase family protein [Anaerococcus hydrogenalis]|uniref:Peptidase, S9A/B/C family, catalytic domain protein n=1 Tax=Anaerococcus hydrogenalis ACS-025-V-Sch4 TaxID=879306 RepID=F0H2W6_9FIRM|nr:S9 family peptidase [Anaerococcus hydrogenalis]EGC83187.1 peptidase, S9A/B/C family, catalytic domain protein [Anaerococcus hydrogenalis ACS-025-V-Sch4]